MLTTLGTGFNTAFIYDRRGERKLLDLPQSASIEWARVLSATSGAVLTLAANQCPTALANVHTWAHSLVIVRDDGSGTPERVWEGPIYRIVDGSEQLRLTAGDVTKWTARRVITDARVLTSNAVTELQWSLAAAFALDDPNVLTHVQVVGGPGPVVTRDVGRGSAYHDADLGSMVSAGGRYTTLGRSVILFPEDTSLGRTRTLHPEDHLLADVDVVEDGESLATRALVRDDAGSLAAAGGPAGAVDDFYGLVDLLASSGPGTTGGDSQSRADSLYARSYPAPVQVDVPDSAQLSCDAPFPMRDLVPGVLVPLETTTATGRRLSMSCQLASVKVTQAAGADEKVTITLVPVTDAVEA